MTYRHQDALAWMAGFRFNQNFRLDYAYDYTKPTSLGANSIQVATASSCQFARAMGKQVEGGISGDEYKHDEFASNDQNRPFPCLLFAVPGNSTAPLRAKPFRHPSTRLMTNLFPGFRPMIRRFILCGISTPETKAAAGEDKISGTPDAMPTGLGNCAKMLALSSTMCITILWVVLQTKAKRWFWGTLMAPRHKK